MKHVKCFVGNIRERPAASENEGVYFILTHRTKNNRAWDVLQAHNGRWYNKRYWKNHIFWDC